MWDLPVPRLEPVSPALAGGFLTTAPPGKSQLGILNVLSPCSHEVWAHDIEQCLTQPDQYPLADLPSDEFTKCTVASELLKFHKAKTLNEIESLAAKFNISMYWMNEVRSGGLITNKNLISLYALDTSEIQNTY